MSEVYKAFAQELKKNRESAKSSMENAPIIFPNAKKGVPYSCSFNIPDKVTHIQFPDISALGLRFVQNSSHPGLWALVGTPIKAGEFDLDFLYHWKGWTPPLQKLRKSIKLIINPDPRELWQNMPTPKSIEYYKEDEASHYAGHDFEIMLAASVRGRSHAHKGMPRDDDFELALDETSKWRILTVADGAGSAAFSRKGSALVCKAAIRTCLEELARASDLDQLLSCPNASKPDQIARAKKLAYKILPQAALEGLKEIRQEALSHSRNVKDYATTLLLALAKPYPTHWAILSFQVGDGAMAVLAGEGRNPCARLLAKPDEGEFGGQTRFITMQEIFGYNSLMNRLHVDIVKDFRALLLMSDGVSDAKFPALSQLESSDSWLKLWAEIEPLAFGSNPENDLLSWLQFWSPGNHDDRTIAMLLQRD